MPMIGGYRKIAAKHGYVLEAFVVYDERRVRLHARVRPDRAEAHRRRSSAERGAPIGAYAVATTARGRPQVPGAPMSVAEIEKVRDVSMMAKSEYGPWAKWWDRMACKTVARRLFKSCRSATSTSATTA
jgi:recombination protein RecT